MSDTIVSSKAARASVRLKLDGCKLMFNVLSQKLFANLKKEKNVLVMRVPGGPLCGTGLRKCNPALSALSMARITSSP